MGQPCKSCQTPIQWVRSVHGRMMPIEMQPSPTGTVWLDVMRVGHVLKKLQQPPPGVKLYVAHFASCPNGPAHRKPKDSVSDGSGKAPSELNAAGRPAPKESAATPATQGDLFRGKP